MAKSKVICVRVSDDIYSVIRFLAKDNEWTNAHAANYLLRRGVQELLSKEVTGND